MLTRKNGQVSGKSYMRMVRYIENCSMVNLITKSSQQDTLTVVDVSSSFRTLLSASPLKAALLANALIAEVIFQLNSIVQH